MLKIKNKYLLILLILSAGYCKKDKIQLMEPKVFIERIENEIKTNYIYADTIPEEEYLRTIKHLEPDTNNISTLNAKEYFIEILRGYYKKDLQIAENFYRESIYQLLKNFQGRNLFIPPSTIKLTKDEQNNSGVGIVLYEDGMGKFLITDVLEGSPAHLGEIKMNQYLEAIDNQSVENFFLEDVVARIKGLPKTKVELIIQGNKYSLYRSTFKLLSVRKTNWKVNNKNILYIQIRFGLKDISKELRQILFDNTNPDYLVLDIRHLSQGDIEEIINIADLFLEKQKLINIVLKNLEKQTIESTSDIYYTGKIIILYQTRTSPFAYVLARLLENNPKTRIIGKPNEATVYIGKEVLLNEDNVNYGALYLTNGYVEFLKESDTSKWYILENFIPQYPPGEKPNLEDPFHKKMIELIQSEKF